MTAGATPGHRKLFGMYSNIGTIQSSFHLETCVWIIEICGFTTRKHCGRKTTNKVKCLVATSNPPAVHIRQTSQEAHQLGQVELHHDKESPKTILPEPWIKYAMRAHDGGIGKWLIFFLHKRVMETRSRHSIQNSTDCIKASFDFLS